MSGQTEMFSVQPTWCLSLPLQQQSVLLLAARGPDGVAKFHTCKNVVRAYRGTVLVAAARRRTLHYGERADSFMCLDRFGDDDTVDELAHRYLMHLAHGAEIAGYKHPDERFRRRWTSFYEAFCEHVHMPPETEAQMDERLNDVFGPEREASTVLSNAPGRCDCMCHALASGLGMSHAVDCCGKSGIPRKFIKASTSASEIPS